MSFVTLMRRAFKPLASRKVRVAIATAIAVWLGEEGFDFSTETIAAIIASGTAVILGIAIEDAGEKSR